MANGLDYDAGMWERGSQRGGPRKRGMGEGPKRRDQEPRKPEKPKAQTTGLYRNEKPGEGESMELEKFTVGDRVRRYEPSQKASMDSGTGTYHAWRPACTLVC